jgi:hypothetical protein
MPYKETYDGKKKIQQEEKIAKKLEQKHIKDQLEQNMKNELQQKRNETANKKQKAHLSKKEGEAKDIKDYGNKWRMQVDNVTRQVLKLRDGGASNANAGNNGTGTSIPGGSGNPLELFLPSNARCSWAQVFKSIGGTDSDSAGLKIRVQDGNRSAILIHIKVREG